MLKILTTSWSLLLLWAQSSVMGQSDSLCPANGAMGLCVEVQHPCFSDSDCYNGDICCPEACSRTCKPRHAKRLQADSSVPDLLNDPRVYIAKCPDSSCFSMFGGDSNECSTAKLCPQEQTCCNDGCRNVCQWKPEYAALIAQEQARARQMQQLVIQKQQEELKQKQREMYVQHERQLAAAELARKQREARAAAEAELAAQQLRSKYEADLKAYSATKAKSVHIQQQSTAHHQYHNNQQQRAATSSQVAPPPGRAPANIAQESQPVLNVNSGSRNVSPQQPQPHFPQPLGASTRGQVSSNRKHNFPGPLINHINSPANFNPYSSLLFQQNVYNKADQGGLMSLFQSAPPTSVTPLQLKNNATANLQQSSHAQKILSALLDLKSSPALSRQNVPPINQAQSGPASYNYLSQQPSSSYVQKLLEPQAPPTYPAHNQAPSYTAQRAPPLYPMQIYNSQSPASLPYRPVNQYTASLPSRQQPHQDSMTPFFMYQAMQSAA